MIPIYYFSFFVCGRKKRKKRTIRTGPHSYFLIIGIRFWLNKDHPWNKKRDERFLSSLMIVYFQFTLEVKEEKYVGTCVDEI